MSRLVRIGIAGALLLASAGCGAECPDGWDYDDASRVCQPPPEVTAAAERRLGTGIYGYAAACSLPSDDDDALDGCHCEYDELADGGGVVLVVGDVDASGEIVPTSRITIPIRPDSTYEAELTPGIAYQLDHITKAGKQADGRSVRTIIVAEGRVELVQLFANEGCPDIF